MNDGCLTSIGSKWNDCTVYPVDLSPPSRRCSNSAGSPEDALHSVLLSAANAKTLTDLAFKHNRFDLMNRYRPNLDYFRERTHLMRKDDLYRYFSPEQIDALKSSCQYVWYHEATTYENLDASTVFIISMSPFVALSYLGYASSVSDKSAHFNTLDIGPDECYYHPCGSFDALFVPKVGFIQGTLACEGTPVTRTVPKSLYVVRWEADIPLPHSVHVLTKV